MKIIIAGAGEVGTHLAKLLARENFDTLLLDEDPLRLKDLESAHDLITVVGSPTSISDLQESGISEVDLFVAVTPLESVNMTACMLASSLGAKKTLARINNYEYLLPKNKEFFERLGVNHLIYPEVLAAEDIVESLSRNWLRQNLSFCDDALVLMGVKVRAGAEILDKKFNSGYFDSENYRVVAIKRGNRTIIPIGNDLLLANDLVYFITFRTEMDYVRIKSGKEDYTIKNVMILGGTKIAQKALKAIPSYMSTKVIESNRERSYALAEKYNNSLIICCDGRNIDALKEEGIEQMDAFVAVTENSESNILACLAAKRLGVRKTIAEVENIDYISLAESMDIGTVINKKMIAASYIYQLTLKADVLNVRTLTSADAEIVEFVAKKGSKITKSLIKDLRLPDQVNLGGFVRNGKGYIINGNSKIEANDHVIVFCVSSAIRNVEKFFN